MRAAPTVIGTVAIRVEGASEIRDGKTGDIVLQSERAHLIVERRHRHRDVG